MNRGGGTVARWAKIMVVAALKVCRQREGISRYQAVPVGQKGAWANSDDDVWPCSIPRRISVTGVPRCDKYLAQMQTK